MDAKQENEKMTPTKSRFEELWEKASNPLTPEQEINEANKELQRIQQEYWQKKQDDYDRELLGR